MAINSTLLQAIDPFEDSPDAFEQQLLEARSLIDSTVMAYRSMASQHAATNGATGTGVSDSPVLRRMGEARQRVSVTLSGEADQATEIATALVQHRNSGDQSVTIRLLCTPKALGTPVVRHIAPRLANCDIRVTEVELGEAVIIDGRVAVVRAPRESDPQGRVMEDPAAARTLELLLACAWRGAVLLDDYERLGGWLQTGVGQRVLEYLYAGSTDAVAAQDMQVSLRTYRRHVAEIMRDLGVNSRFQAGVRAAELHLLPEAG